MGGKPRSHKVHDLTHQSGHVWRPKNGGQQGWMSNWSYFTDGDPREGDYFLLRNGDSTTRYRVIRFKRMMDPRDQWFADLEFAPRPNNIPRAVALHHSQKEKDA